jgi:hypothetical protein
LMLLPFKAMLLLESAHGLVSCVPWCRMNPRAPAARCQRAEES